MSQRRSTARPAAGRQHRRRGGRALAVAALAAALLLGTAVPAGAAPPDNPSDEQLGDARSAKEAAAAEVGRISALVARAENELQQLSYRAEAAGAAYMAAEEALATAQAAADETAARLAAAARAVDSAVSRIGAFSRDSYMSGATLTTTAALIDVAGPGELIRRAAMLDWVADNQVDVLTELEVAKVEQANADSAARDARDQMAAAEAAAEAAKADADRQVAAQQGAYERAKARQADYAQQLQQAQVTLLRLQGARNAYQEWQEQKRAAEQRAAAEAERARREAEEAARRAREAALHGGGGGGGGASDGGGGGGASDGGSGGGSGGYVKPFSGIVTSCFGARWGVTHYGLDVASSIGTPLYAPIAGTVVRAGAATGFGLAVYLRGDDGAVFVYGHINDYFVRAGDRVVAGQRIAEVGNTGFSTGPHVHFEVHPGGSLYSGAVDPVPWLNARGVYVGGCGG